VTILPLTEAADQPLQGLPRTLSEFASPHKSRPAKGIIRDSNVRQAIAAAFSNHARGTGYLNRRVAGRRIARRSCEVLEQSQAS
jgi:hypothetical protein